MKKGHWIYLLILIILAIAIDFSILKADYIIPVATESYSFDTNRFWMVSSDTPEIDIITASTGYYRIRSGNTIVEGEPIAGDYFQKSTSLPVGNWIVEENSMSISVKFPSEDLVVIVSKPTTGSYFGYILLTVIFGILFFLFGYSIFD